MFLIIYIYAVIGTNLFADVKMQGPMHEYLNFQKIALSYLTLIRVSSGESWIDLMNALGKEKGEFNDCVENPSYEDYVAAGYNPVGCGNYLITYIFFFTYLMMITLVFLNLFVAIILNGYLETKSETE